MVAPGMIDGDSVPRARPARSVAGRVAVVTGAGSGMGRATARLLAEEGASVACWDRDGEAVAATEDVVTGAGGRAVAVTVDIADEVAVRDAHALTRDSLGPVDLLVNNAGISVPAALDADDWRSAWDRTLAVNLTGPALVLRTLLEDLRRNGEGRVVNVASTEGLGATAFLSPYTAAKHGVIGLTRSAAVELATAGVTVNCVCPGPVRTGMTAIIPDDHKDRFARRRVPMRRYGEPEEVADVIVSLLLPSATYMTGAVVTVDGGLTVQNT
jgi:3-oxoacyl-[acyl-carrier protein] reductase